MKLYTTWSHQKYLIVLILIWCRLIGHSIVGVDCNLSRLHNLLMRDTYPCVINSLCQCTNAGNGTHFYKISCHDVWFYKFTEILQNSIKIVEMSKNNLQCIDDETFQGLQLDSLKLADNNIQYFSAKSFNSMAYSLRLLDISDNQMGELPLDAIRNLHSLNRIIANKNKIQSLDGDYGYLSDALRSLQVSGNSIAELNFADDDDEYMDGDETLSQQQQQAKPQQQSHQRYHHHQQMFAHSMHSTNMHRSASAPFAKLRKLMWLDVSDNRISHIAANYLPRSIITLNLSDNLFTEVPVNMLQHLHQLRSLFMRNNLLKSLANIERYTSPMLLERFDVSYNAIDEFPVQLFNGNSTIKIIIMEKNLMRHIPAGAFRNLSTSRLAMAFNRIDHIDANAFAGIEQTLEHLDLEHNLLTELPKAVMSLKQLYYLYMPSNGISILDTLPSSIKALSLAANNFTAMPVQALRQCTDLMYLNMGYNKIVELPENVFVDWAGKLETLFLRNNKITSLNYGVFNGLDAIRELSLSFNDIHYTHPMVFENISRTLTIFELSFALYRDDFPTETLKCLTELMWLSLDNNNLKKISDDSLITLAELVHINLAFNRIAMFPPTILVAEIHKRLKEIDLSYNALTKVYTNTFDGLLMLHTVRLTSNRITSLDMHSFHNLPALEYVDLTHNLLRNISENVFTFLPRLLQLDLMYNHLEHLTFKIFKHATNETMPLRLNISHNRINTLDGEINSFLYIASIDATSNELNDSQSFRYVGHSLKELILRKNSFSLLNNHAFNELYNLDWLDLSHNNLSVLRRRCFQGLVNLQKLELNNNHINQLQTDQFADLRNLRILNLSHNRLRSLPREIFVHTRIEYLDLSNNQLMLWPANSLSDIGFTLRHIHMEANEIEYLEPNMFINTQYVYTLNVSKNKLVVIPDNTFAYLSNLTNLDLSYNPLVTANLEQIFLHTPMLRVLNLRSMGLYHMPSMAATQYLTELDVSMNNLQETSNLTRLKHLRVLRIAVNKVSNMSALAERLPTVLRVIDLSRNPVKRILVQDFVRLRRLEELYMRACIVRNSMAFAQLKNLKVFHLDAQPLFADIVANLYGLQELRIEVHGELLDGHILSKLRNHTKLSSVEITGKHLASISSNAFVGLSNSYNLKLTIHNTQINDFPPTIFYALRSIPHLTIDLSNNNVANLAPDSFYPNASSWDSVGTRSIIGGLDVYGNSLQCECGLVWLGHWLRRWIREVSHMHSLTDDEFKELVERARRNTCTDPQTGKVVPFLEVFPEDLLCHASALSSSAVNKCMQMPTIVRIFILLLIFFCSAFT